MSVPSLLNGRGAAAKTAAPIDELERKFQQLKTEIHQQLVESLDPSRLGDNDRKRLQKYIRQLADEACSGRKDVLGRVEQERLVEELMAETFGLGPIEPFLHDPTVTDILVNNPDTVYVERFGRLELTNVMFADEDHLKRIIQRVVARLGRRIDEVSPMVDARLPDGSRVNAVIRPLALDGPALSIRRFGKTPLTMEDLLRNGSILPQMVDFLRATVEARLGMLVSGGTGAGKTTLLNALSAFIPAEERVVTIEDSAELILQHRHRVRLETRPANAEGAGEISQRDLVRNALRMRPDRIIVGEVRGPEVWDMLQAMNTGHEGSLTTVHANSAFDALARVEMMAAMTGFDLPVHIVRQYIASGIRLIAHLARLKGGVRRVTEISEIVGVKDGSYELRPLFGFEQTDVQRGMAVGRFHATGNVPSFLPRIRAAGIQLDEAIFERRQMSACAEDGADSPAMDGAN